MSLLAGVVDVEQLGRALEAAQAEQRRLEALHEQRLGARREIEALEAEALEVQSQARGLRKLAEEEVARIHTESQRRSWVDPARERPPDDEAQAKAVEGLRRRQQGLRRLLELCSDATVRVREEDGLTVLRAELRQAERERQDRERELAVSSKQVDAFRLQAEKGGGGGGGGGSGGGGGKQAHAGDDLSPEAREERDVAYVKRLADAAQRMGAQRDQTAAAAAQARSELMGWLGLLGRAARKLQARADAGAEGAVRLEESTTAAEGEEGEIEGGAASSAAFLLIGHVGRLSQQHRTLRKREADSKAAEAAYELQLKTLRSKIAAQDVAIGMQQRLDAVRAKQRARLDARRAAAASSRAAVAQAPTAGGDVGGDAPAAAGDALDVEQASRLAPTAPTASSLPALDGEESPAPEPDAAE